MRKYRLQRAGRRISLFRTAGSSRNSHRSPRPEPWCKNIYHKHHRRTPSPAKSAARRQDPSPSAQPQWKKKTEEENWSDSTESAAEAATYHQQSATQDKVKSTILSPESPPDYERGLSTTDYIPKSPIYHPAGYSDEEEDSELDSMLTSTWMRRTGMRTTHQQVPRIQIHLRKKPLRRTLLQNRKQRAPPPSSTRQETTLTTSTWTQMKCFSQDSPRLLTQSTQPAQQTQ